MTDNKKIEYLTRNQILKMLSDDEVARVGTAESAAHLSEGDEYLDLEKLDRGVQTAGTTGPAMGDILPKKSVQEATWNRMLALLANPGAGTHVAA